MWDIAGFDILQYCSANLTTFQGDIIEYICNVRVLSVKHANKQLKTATDLVTFNIKRHKNRFRSEDGSQQYRDHDMGRDIEV